MNSIDTRIVIGGMAPRAESKSQTESNPEKISFKGNTSGISA